MIVGRGPGVGAIDEQTENAAGGEYRHRQHQKQEGRLVPRQRAIPAQHDRPRDQHRRRRERILEVGEGFGVLGGKGLEHEVEERRRQDGNNQEPRRGKDDAAAKGRRAEGVRGQHAPGDDQQ